MCSVLLGSVGSVCSVLLGSVGSVCSVLLGSVGYVWSVCSVGICRPVLNIRGREKQSLLFILQGWNKAILCQDTTQRLEIIRLSEDDFT